MFNLVCRHEFHIGTVVVVQKEYAVAARDRVALSSQHRELWIVVLVQKCAQGGLQTNVAVQKVVQLLIFAHALGDEVIVIETVLDLDKIVF